MPHGLSIRYQMEVTHSCQNCDWVSTRTVTQDEPFDECYSPEFPDGWGSYDGDVLCAFCHPEALRRDGII